MTDEIGFHSELETLTEVYNEIHEDRETFMKFFNDLKNNPKLKGARIKFDKVGHAELPGYRVKKSGKVIATIWSEPSIRITVDVKTFPSDKRIKFGIKPQLIPKTPDEAAEYLMNLVTALKG